MFKLDPRLRSDTYAVGMLPLCQVLLMNESRYPWYILVPRHGNACEVFDLPPESQRQLWQESVLLARTVHSLHQAEKMNVATLGNVVRQLHMHVVARRPDDAAWPGPVWGRHPAIPYAEAQARAAVSALRAALEGHWIPEPV